MALNLTFGIELEFALCTLPSTHFDPHPSDPRNAYGITREEARSPMTPQPSLTDYDDEVDVGLFQDAQKHVASTLNRNGIEAKSILNEGILFEDEIGKVDNKWIITDDGTVKGIPGATAYTNIPFECQSPPLVFCQSSLRHVQKVVGVLCNTYRIVTNGTTGLHCHVGNSSAGFELEHLRKLVAFLWTFEPQLHAMHGERANADFCRALRRHSNLAVSLEARRPRASRQDGLTCIFKADSVNGLLHLMGASDGMRLGYHFANLAEAYTDDSGQEYPAVEEIKKTIEFRHHEGTLNPDRIRDWISLCVGLVDFANTVHSSVLEIFCRQHINDDPESFSVAQILAAAGMPDLGFKYAYRVANMAWLREQEKWVKEAVLTSVKS